MLSQRAGFVPESPEGSDMRDEMQPTADPAWVMDESGYEPLQESNLESRFTVSNGFLGVRGARAIGRGPMWVSWQHTFNWASWPRTYVAGLFDTPNIEPPVPALVPAADWLRIRILLNGVPLLRRSGQVLELRRRLDLKRGLLIDRWQQLTPAGIVARMSMLRLVSQAQRALGLQLLLLELEPDGVDVVLDASFDTAVLGLQPVKLDHDCGLWRTEQSGMGLAMASAASLRLDGVAIPPSALDALSWCWNWRSVAGQAVSFERLVAVRRSDEASSELDSLARAELGLARQIGWRGVLAAHEAAWAERWRCSDVEIEGDDAAQQALRFAIYHLNSAANPGDERVSIGARALTGDAYLGHVFWDTETYLLPFYVLTWPEAARALLMYRYHTLPGARAKAAAMGWRGALYAWESADTGEETTPETVLGPDGRPVRVLCGLEEQHISADVAYAVWQYWRATGDEDFLLDAGAEIILETARFWASRAQPEADGRRHIRGVIGPDEYHEHIDDNAYTNMMARWNIRRGLEVAARLAGNWPDRWAALAARLGLADAELGEWRAAERELVTGYDPRTGLFEQFAGFFELEDINLADYAGRSVPMDVVIGRERTQHSQVVKQADVVALLALLSEEVDPRSQEINFRHYEPRCGHGSSLSRAMHAIVAARLGDVELALRYFRETAAIDLADIAGGSAGGVHIAALGGLWQAAVLGFAGLTLQDDALAIDPKLPAAWRRLGFRIQWRGRRVAIDIGPDSRAEVTLEAGEPFNLLVSGQPVAFRREQPRRREAGRPG